jgi:Mg2+-importing ATPase
VTTRSATASREGDPSSGDSRPPEILVAEAAGLAAEQVLERLGSAAAGLTTEEAGRRLSLVGPNAVRTHRAQPLRILVRQLRSPVLILLAVTATISFFLGQRTDTVVIGVILVASIGLGFVNEYRAERATDALHSQVTHRTVVMRAGRPVEVDVTTLVPGDVVRLGLGEVVPADLRLLSTVGLECDESVLTGESLPADKAVAAVAPRLGAGRPHLVRVHGHDRAGWQRHRRRGGHRRRR